MAPWEDFASSVWTYILCTSLVFWQSTCVPSPGLLAFSKLKILHLVAELYK